MVLPAVPELVGRSVDPQHRVRTDRLDPQQEAPLQDRRHPRTLWAPAGLLPRRCCRSVRCHTTRNNWRRGGTQRERGPRRRSPIPLNSPREGRHRASRWSSPTRRRRVSRLCSCTATCARSPMLSRGRDVAPRSSGSSTASRRNERGTRGVKPTDGEYEATAKGLLEDGPNHGSAGSSSPRRTDPSATDGQSRELFRGDHAMGCSRGPATASARLGISRTRWGILGSGNGLQGGTELVPSRRPRALLPHGGLVAAARP